MPQGSKEAYTDKQKRQAEHIAEGYEASGSSEKSAKRKAWATVNAMTGGGKKSGSGRGKKVNKAPAIKGGKIGGKKKAKKVSKKKSSTGPAKKKTVRKKSKTTGKRSTKKKTVRKKKTKKS